MKINLRDIFSKIINAFECHCRETLRRMDADNSKTKYGLSGSSVYADHEDVLRLAIEDQRKMKQICRELNSQR